MRKSVAPLLAGLCVVAWAARGFTQTRTLTGQVIDLTCYTWNEEDVGMHHISQGGHRAPNVGFECAYSCVRWQAMPAGLLTSDGKVYQIAGGLAANSNVKIAPHLTHTVRITGVITEVDDVLILTADDVTRVK